VTEVSERLTTLLAPIRPQMERVEGWLYEATDRVEEPLRSMLRDSLSGGKHLRSALVILAGGMFDVPPVPFCRLGAAVGTLHVATLIHDDSLDGTALRRGREALHATWSARAAILVGDYLLGEATALIAELEHPHLLTLFAETLRTMCAGEIRRMFAVQEIPPSFETYYRTVEAKTASLFAAAMEMAAVLAGADERSAAALRLFGWELGVAFQIVDDVLDVVGEEAQLGKPAGSDLRQGVVTLPILYYLEWEQDHGPVAAVLSGRRDEARVQAAIAAIGASGAVEAAMADARSRVARSQAALASLPDSPSRRALAGLAEYIADRQR